jgi:hypothetical protein
MTMKRAVLLVYEKTWKKCKGVLDREPTCTSERSSESQACDGGIREQRELKEAGTSL